MSDSDQLKYIMALAETGEPIATMFVCRVHQEPVRLLEHIRLVGAGLIPVPPLRVQQVAAAECVVDRAHAYLGVLYGTRVGDGDRERLALAESVGLYERLVDEGFRAEPGAAEVLVLPDLARAFVRAFQDVEMHETKDGGEFRKLLDETARTFRELGEFVDGRAAAAA